MTPPTAPSQLLPGLIEGASLRRPHARPTKYAALSAIHTSTRTSNTSSGLSASMARPAGTSTAKPAAPLAAAVRSDGLVERRGVEVGPQRLGEVELAIRELPQQEVADALLAAGADEEIRLRRIVDREIRGQRFFINRCFRVILDQLVK